MKRMTFKTICEKLAANSIVKISTTWGWQICKSEEIKIDSKKKILEIPAFSKYWGAYMHPVRCGEVISIENAA